jgi:hypothetical protein
MQNQFDKQSEIRTFVLHVFANNLFGTFNKTGFNGFEISMQFCIFLYPVFNFLIKFFCSYYHFF